jgi:hypothetical protein
VQEVLVVVDDQAADGHVLSVAWKLLVAWLLPGCAESEFSSLIPSSPNRSFRETVIEVRR